ncbi:hypothetical protein NKF06_14110 [Haloferax sp. AB510]|uniref:hypothetical protein n=1 Tax=Haloferax sp. AB510 TaxID=2934172 RepID=UPI00209C6C33|nr:hypothetical protein [Haloferax sp. AB510]MCO8267686.1 hypothetical protein [Haloferax sp. AB510]
MSLQTDSNSNATVTPRFEADSKRSLRGLGGLTAFLIVWWIGAMMTQPSYLVPGPVASVRAFVDLFATSTAIVVPVLGSEMVPCSRGEPSAGTSDSVKMLLASQ